LWLACGFGMLRREGGRAEMKNVAAAAAVVLLLPLAFARQASAQETFSPNWAGWYAGVNGGYGFGSNDIHLNTDSPGAVVRAGFVSPELNVKPNGPLGGGQIGKNWQQGKFVYGFESDLAYAGIRDNVVGPILLPGFDFQTTQTQKLEWFGTLRARAGVVVSDRALIFLSGGLAYGQAELSTFANTPRPCVGTNFCVTGYSREWLAGWTVGTGMDYALASNWSAKFEYLYYDLGKIDSTVLDINPASFVGVPGIDVFRGSSRINGSIVRIGLNYKFDTQ